MNIPTYVIRDWNDIYENNRTRELKRLDWVPIPNRMDGDGYTELVNHPNGASHLGAWLAMVQIASRCDVRGTLSRDGARPHDPASLSRISRIPKEVFEEVIPRLLDIGWLLVSSEDTNTCQTPQGPAILPQADAGIPQDGAPRARAFRKGMEGNGIEGNGKKSGDAPEEQRAGPSPQEPPPPLVSDLAKSQDLKTAIRKPPLELTPVLQVYERAKDWLIKFPGAQRLPGKPDDKIIRRCLELAGGRLEVLAEGLKAMSQADKAPRTSWAYFPEVLQTFLDPRC